MKRKGHRARVRLAVMAAIVMAIGGCTGCSGESGDAAIRLYSEEEQGASGENTGSDSGKNTEPDSRENAGSGSRENTRTDSEETDAGSGDPGADFAGRNTGTGEGNAVQGRNEVNQEANDGNSEEPEILEDAAADSGLINENTLKFSMAQVPGLPEEVAAQMEQINAGGLLKEIVGLDELEGFYALIGAKQILAVDPDTQEEVVGSGKLTLYVPNLLKSLADVSVLFYDKADSRWRIIPAEQTDTEARTVTVTLTGSGVLTVIYRNNRS